MTPEQARARLLGIRGHLELPRVMYRNQIGPMADLYRAVDEIVSFLEEALA